VQARALSAQALRSHALQPDALQPRPLSARTLQTLSMTGSGMLFPTVPALVTWNAQQLEVLDVTGQSLQATGRFADELRQLVGEGGAHGAVLDALPPEDPLGLALRRLADRPRVPLSPAAALHLGGFRTLFLELTGRCTQRCLHCYAGAGPEVTTDLARETCEAVLDDAAQLGFTHIQLTGGEPLLCEFLPELVQRVAACDGPTCEIYTNGVLLDDALLDRLAPWAPAFAFSYYSYRPEVHEAVTGTPGSHARTTAAIQRALARGLRVRVAMIVMPENAADVEQTMAQLRALGVSSVSFGRAFAVGRGRLFEGKLPDPCDGIEGARDEGGTPSQLGRLCVSHDGAVYPCIFNRTDLLGRVTERRLAEIARTPRLRPRLSARARLEQVRSSIPCVECQLTACALAAAGHGEGG
jgi:MoaA/NifB/PqqE/SkfB family radical SAM enzyme